MWKTLHCTRHRKNVKSKVTFPLFIMGEALTPAVEIHVLGPKCPHGRQGASHAQRPQNGHGSWKDMGPNPCALAEGEHFQLLETCCKFWGHRSSWEEQPGHKQVGRTRLDKHKAWK